MVSQMEISQKPIRIVWLVSFKKKSYHGWNGMAEKWQQTL